MDENPLDGESNILNGRPRERILLTVKCFKKLCLKANTTKSDEIHDYYIKLEEINFEYLLHESENSKLLAIAEEKEKHVMSDFKKENGDTEKIGGVYFLHLPLKKMIEFGSTYNIYDRIKTHKKNIKQMFVDKLIKTKEYMKVKSGNSKMLETRVEQK